MSKKPSSKSESPSPKGKKGKPKRRGPVGWFLTLAIGLCALYLVGSVGLCWLLIGPNDRGLMLEPHTRGVSVGEIELTSKDGTKLSAWYSDAPDKPVVLLAHGRGEHRGQFREVYTALYLQHALAFFCFDFRGSGKSEGFFSTGGVKEAEDLAAALDWLRAKGYARSEIALVASDMGAVAALQMPARIDELACCIFVAPSEDTTRQLQRRLRRYHVPLRPTASLALFGARLLTKSSLEVPQLDQSFAKLHYAPLLFLAGEKDDIAPPELVRGWLQMVPNADKEMQVLAGLDHAGMLEGESPELIAATLAFLREKLDF